MSKEVLEQKAEEWRKKYKPMGITRIERAGVEVETQAKPTKIIENPNPFRITDGWYELYLKDLENAYIAGYNEAKKGFKEEIEYAEKHCLFSDCTQNENLKKAKEIIEELMMTDQFDEKGINELYDKTEQFLKEVEK